MTKLQSGTQPMYAKTKTDDRRAAKAAIYEEASRLCAARCNGRVSGLVLTGSLARDEGTDVQGSGSWTLLSDAEFLLVLTDGAPLLSLRQESLLRQSIEGNLAERGIHCKISLSSCHADYLRGMRPNIFAYELKACGQVVLGDPEILRLVPEFSAAQIPREDAWRLLCNRMVEHVGVCSAFAGRPERLPRALYYHTLKLYLDMATSLLLFVGAYEPTYQRRAARLKSLADSGSIDESGLFPLGRFAERVDFCTQSKLRGLSQEKESQLETQPNGSWALWEEAIAYLRQLWRWELQRLTGLKAHSSDRELLKAWIRRQSVYSCLRGWVYTLRRRGWVQSWREWPRWGWRGMHASPRYWIYDAASELFFRLPSLVAIIEKRTDDEIDFRELLARLPVTSATLPKNGYPSWRRVAAEIFWNYSEFVVDTRS